MDVVRFQQLFDKFDRLIYEVELSGGIFYRYWFRYYDRKYGGFYSAGQDIEFKEWML